MRIETIEKNKFDAFAIVIETEAEARVLRAALGNSSQVDIQNIDSRVSSKEAKQIYEMYDDLNRHLSYLKCTMI